MTPAAESAPRWAFVTGASSGLGAALARRYAARGFRVGCFARNAAALSRLAEELGAEHCVSAVGDVRDADAVAAAARALVARWGPPAVVIANAGVSRGTLTEFAEDLPEFRAILDTNVLGLVHTFQPFVAPMREAGRGTLAGIASVAGFRGLPGSSAYCASKAAAIAYLDALRVELRDHGIRVVTICPGYVDTPMTARNPYPMPFLLAPDDAAERIGRAIDSGRRFAVIPWQMSVLGALFRALPRPVLDRVLQVARPKRKPRAGER